MYRGSSFGSDRRSPYRLTSKDSDSGKGDDSLVSSTSAKSSRSGSDSDFSTGERSPSTYKTTGSIMLSRHESDRSSSNGSSTFPSKYSGSTPKYIPLNERLKGLRGSNQNLNGSDSLVPASRGSGIRERGSLRDLTSKPSTDESATSVSHYVI